ncbi:hypothetical protein Cgig2_001031 [Carnegiea gigantea]|uniref:Uncharacterized protein n=1 Tax=Carnegiea gigantea TaxID=171969 RepID=A0A9Q1GVN8_9CARY|nr:hypothetical protein Cgig2_001031 [Carnegiea gigantea]
MPPPVCFGLATTMVSTEASAPSTSAQSQYLVASLDPVTRSPNLSALRLHPSRRPPLSRRHLSFFQLPSRALTSPQAMTPSPRPSSPRPGLRLLLPWALATSTGSEGSSRNGVHNSNSSTGHSTNIGRGRNNKWHDNRSTRGHGGGRGRGHNNTNGGRGAPHQSATFGG